MFESSSASCAERTCRSAVEKLTPLLVEAGVLHAVRQRVEIQFDFVSGTAAIVRLAEWNMMVRMLFAKKAIAHVLRCYPNTLMKSEVLIMSKIYNSKVF